TAVRVLQPGRNELVSEPVLLSQRLIDDTVQVRADIRYRRADAANYATFATGFAPDGIAVLALPTLALTDIAITAPNAPYVDKGQAFSLPVQIANLSADTLHAVAVALSSTGGSRFDPLRLMPVVKPHDTVTIVYSVQADSLSGGAETFTVSLSSEETGNIGAVGSMTAIIQEPALLDLRYVLSGARDHTVQAGQTFSLLVTLDNSGEAEVGVGEYLFTTGGVDFGVADSTTGVIATDTTLILTMTAPPFETEAELNFALTTRPVELNTGLPPRIVNFQFSLPVRVVKQQGELVVSATVPDGGLYIPGEPRDVFRMLLASRNVTGDALFGVKRIEFEVTTADGAPVDARELFDPVGSGAYEGASQVGDVTMSGNRLFFDFPKLLFDSTTERSLNFRLQIRSSAVDGFRLRTSAASVHAEWATGPLTGQPVLVVAADGAPLVLTQSYVATAADLKNSFTLQQNPFNPNDSAAVFAYRLSRPGTVEFRVFTLAGELVYTRIFPDGSPETVPGMQQLITWDGRNDDGRQVMNGVYVAMIRQDATGEQATLKVAVVK
ncbi:MAG: hypothetical protein D6800_02205, partial [Candidatus Zixiibacteriota bacterium]